MMLVRTFWILLLSLAMPAASVAGSPPAPQLQSSVEISKDGSFRLFWSGVEPAEEVLYELQQASKPDFGDAEPVYTGADRATVISGASDGARYYRLRVVIGPQKGPWSAGLKVVVEHHPLSKALLLFGLGAVVFLATLAMIVAGNRRDKRGG